jgi:hypothetical protein
VPNPCNSATPKPMPGLRTMIGCGVPHFLFANSLRETKYTSAGKGVRSLNALPISRSTAGCSRWRSYAVPVRTRPAHCRHGRTPHSGFHARSLASRCDNRQCLPPESGGRSHPHFVRVFNDIKNSSHVFSFFVDNGLIIVHARGRLQEPFILFLYVCHAPFVSFPMGSWLLTLSSVFQTPCLAASASLP